VAISLNGIDPEGLDAAIQINIQGLLNLPHNIHAVLNGIDLGVVTGNGLDHFSGTFVLPPDLAY
jgi:hypothetical protein